MKRFELAFLVVLITLSSSAAMAFRDDFNTLDTSVWQVYYNGGTVSIQNGNLILASTGTAFPYLYSKGIIFPQNCDFVLRVGMRYIDIEPYGTGMWATTSPATNGQIGDPGGTWGYWADIPGNGAGTKYHNLEWRYSGHSVEQWFDGAFVGTLDCNRPTSFCLGNNRTVPGGFSWTSFSVDYIEVVSVPEPSSILALLTGVCSVGGLACRKRK